MLTYYLLFVLFVCIALLEDELTPKAKAQTLLLSAVLLILFAGLRSNKVGADYKAYETLYQLVQNPPHLFANPVQLFVNYRLEPSFLLLSSFIKAHFNDGIKVLIFLYAIIGISLKIKAIQKISDYKLLSLLIYFSGIFFLHDMNQIRAGVAIGFLLLSIPYIVERNIKIYFLLVLIAVLFHYSAIIFVLFYFVDSKRINQGNYLLIILVPIILCLLKLDLISLLCKFEFGIFSEKIRAYSELQKTVHSKINIFNFGVLLQIIVSLFFIMNVERTENKYAVILTKISCFGIAFFYLFSSAPVIAFREFELLSCVQIFLIPLSIDLVKPKVFAQLFVFVISLAYFLNQMLINSIFGPYSTFF